MKFICAYDTERLGDRSKLPDVPSCLEACRRIVEVHREHNAPATFFIVGRLLEHYASEFRELLDDPLFEIASHSYSHAVLIDHPVCGPAVSPERLTGEIRTGKDVIEQLFGRRCAGFRPACGFDGGFTGHPSILEIIADAGYSYTSSDLWGRDFSLPVPIKAPYDYADDGFPDLAELPACGWHENLLKGNNRIGNNGVVKPIKTLLFPPLFPGAIPDAIITTPEEEMKFNNRFFIDLGRETNASYVSLIWHPWSLGFFDPPMRMLGMTLELIRSAPDIELSTFAAERERLSMPASTCTPL